MDKRPFLASLTHLRIRGEHPLKGMIEKYQSERVSNLEKKGKPKKTWQKV
jgi:hypothetical protein